MPNAMQIRPPEHLTVRSLREYLDQMEADWSEEDKKFMGEFEDHRINTLYGPPTFGIGQAKIIYDGGLDFVILPAEDK